MKDLFMAIGAIALFGLLIGVPMWAMGQDIHDRNAQMEGINKQIANLREQAIAHGAAEYVITDPASGKTEFRWIERAKP